MSTWITICDTCKREGWTPDEHELTDGEVLAGLIERFADGHIVQTRRTSCLMGCTHGCNVAIQGKGKLAYTIGNFTAEPEVAEAIVQYALLHAESETGQVPYRQWPIPIKGHFITRHPPLPETE